MTLKVFRRQSRLPRKAADDTEMKLRADKLKAQMKAIQAKVKVFEKARIKAQRETQENALEAQCLKDEVAARHLAADAPRKKADKDESWRKTEERRSMADATVEAAKAVVASRGVDDEDAAHVVAVKVRKRVI